MKNTHNFWRIRAIADNTKRHGIWAGFRFAVILIRGLLREHFGRHQKAITNAWFAVMFLAGTAIVYGFRQNFVWPQSPGEALQGTILFAIAIACILISLGKVCLGGPFHQQLWLFCLGSFVFAAFLAACGFFFYTPWNAAYLAAPGKATLAALLGCGVLLGFRPAIGWFLRALIQPNHEYLDPSEISGLTREGRRRVCLHEAGHALCYGLCDGVPEDASVAMDTDSFNVMMGVVTLPSPRDLTEITKSLLEWRMLCLMAGSAAEKHFLGEESVCGAGDKRAMHGVAAMYLMAGYGEAYDAETKDEAQIDANRRAIKRLMDGFMGKASQLIALNPERCLQLADVIDRLEYLGCEEIASNVEGVIFPEETARLNWPRGVALYQPST